MSGIILFHHHCIGGMDNLQDLIRQVNVARQEVISLAKEVSSDQSVFKPSEDSWSIVDIVEHLVWAEQGGINGIWKALEGIKKGVPVWQGELIHHGLRIERIIELTWQEKEKVPESAKPRWGGPVKFWIASLDNTQKLLEELGAALDGFDCEKIIYPHIISGPLNVIQRMEFLRFHFHRHRRQIENVISHPDFPKT